MNGFQFGGDLELRRMKIMEQISDTIAMNKQLELEASRAAKKKDEFQSELTRLRQLTSASSAQLQVDEKRKEGFEHAIAVEQARITEARNQLESLKGELANAKADVTKTIEAATEELRRCYKIEYNEDELKRKLDKATSALTLLKHQAYLLKSNALRLNADAQDEKAVRNDLTAQRDELVGKRAALAEEALALDKQFLPSAMDEAARERMWALQRHLADLDAATLDNEGIVRLASLCASDDAAVSPLLEVLSAIKTTTKDALAALAINKGAAFGDGSLTQTASAVLCSATVPLIPAPGEETGAGGSVSCGEAVYESIRSICDGASTDVQALRDELNELLGKGPANSSHALAAASANGEADVASSATVEDITPAEAD